MPSDRDQIRILIERWATAVQACDLAAVLEDHTDDIVMFDVPPPEDGARGMAAYRATWEPFFGYIRNGATFQIVSLEITAGAEVAYAHALLRCGMPDHLAQHPGERLRLTIGLRKEDGRWRIAHEHHSFTHKT